MYINRSIEQEIKPFLERKEVISIIGPRQAGKTTLLKNLEKELICAKKTVKFITFENVSDLTLFQSGIIAERRKHAKMYPSKVLISIWSQLLFRHRR